MSVGSADHPDPRSAGATAAACALTGADVKLLVVFCSAHYDPAAVLEGIRATAGDVPLIGCSSGGQIAADGSTAGRVVVTALGGPDFTVATSAATGAAARQREVGAGAAACAAGLGDPAHAVLMLLTDGLAPDQEQIISGAYEVVGASVPLVGGAASPGPDVRRTFLFHDDQVLTDAVVGAAIGSSSPFGIGVRHGWRKVGEPMLVTRSADRRVYELDQKPALPTYLERLGAPAEAYTDPAAFDRFARTRPLGVRRRSGEEVRNVSSTEFLREGWLGCGAEVPEGGLVWLMEGDESSVLDAADDACRTAVDALSGYPPIGLIAFDCVSRSGLLGDGGTRVEVRRMIDQAGGAPLAGFYTWGEIARTRGINGFHHQTLVVLAVS
ncbi:MAG: hypothetical protein AUI14_09305 [Actinobacteria bacterium 13_2_20CM_2_71_6]|nr:MAG: hypothetical protein AUI14_09305 [Actinobacteria bacterium 13_2_20CM_2_71_6]